MYLEIIYSTWKTHRIRKHRPGMGDQSQERKAIEEQQIEQRQRWLHGTEVLGMRRRRVVDDEHDNEIRIQHQQPREHHAYYAADVLHKPESVDMRAFQCKRLNFVIQPCIHDYFSQWLKNVVQCNIYQMV